MKIVAIKFLAAAMLVNLATGCAVAPSIGSTYGKVAPQLISVKARLANGKESNTVVWNHPEYFGPVPLNLKAKAKKVCQASLNANSQLYKNIDRSRVDAIGYHPLARNLQGKRLSGGGYYCNISTQGTNYKHPKHRTH